MAPSAVGRLPAKVVGPERGPAQQVDRVARRRRQPQPSPAAQAELVVCEQAIDITFLPTWSGFLYLAVVLDAFSRRVVGWAMAEHLRAELVVAALEMALRHRRPAPGLIHHSDHGGQYSSLAFGRRCRESGVVPSMGSVGD